MCESCIKDILFSQETEAADAIKKANAQEREKEQQEKDADAGDSLISKLNLKDLLL